MNTKSALSYRAPLVLTLPAKPEAQWQAARESNAPKMDKPLPSEHLDTEGRTPLCGEGGQG